MAPSLKDPYCSNPLAKFTPLPCRNFQAYLITPNVLYMPKILKIKSQNKKGFEKLVNNVNELYKLQNI